MLASMREPDALERAYRTNRAGDLVLLALASACAAFAGGTGAASSARGATPWRVAAALAVVATPFWLLAGRLLHQYHAANGRSVRGDVALTSLLVLGVAAATGAVLALVPAQATLADVGRFTAVLLPTVLLLRALLVDVPLWRSRPSEAVLVVGVGALGRLTGIEVARGEAPRAVVGYLRFDEETPRAPLPAPELGSVRALEEALKRLVVDEVYFASTAAEHHDEIQDAIRTCERLGVPFAVPACTYRLTRATPMSGVTDGYTHFTNARHKPVQRALKRAFDVFASGFALLALAPLLMVVAALVKLTSPGPVLFRQERVGLFGRSFPMLKFRSMVADAEARKEALLAHNEQSGPVFKMRHDPRITPLGRFLRKYSIDELPQLVNVLRGDMSIVGPRPPLASEVARYEGWQRRRLSVRPGLTCVWQVSGRNDVSFQDWMLLDMRYIDHWSLLADFGLIFRTLPVVVLGRGAS